MGEKAVPPIPPRLEIVKHAVARALRRRLELGRQLDDALAIDVAHDRHDEPLVRVDGDAEMEIVLHEQSIALGRERRAQRRMLAQRDHDGLHHEQQRRELDALRARLILAVATEALELRDVGFVVLGDVGDVLPGALERRARDLLDPRERLLVDGPEARRIDEGHRRDPARAPGARDRPLRALARESLAHLLLHVVDQDATVRPRRIGLRDRHTELPREPPHERTRMREPRLIGYRIGRRGRDRSSRSIGLESAWPRRRRGCRDGGLLRLRRLRLGLVGRRCLLQDRLVDALENREQAPLGDAIALLHRELEQNARRRRRDLHRRLLALDADQRIVDRHAIAGLNEDLDDLDLVEVADVGHPDLASLGHAALPARQRRLGAGRSASMPYFSIARATLARSNEPSSARAESAETQT